MTSSVSRFCISSLALFLAFVHVTPAAAERCVIRISASGPFRGTVTDHNTGAFTRFAIKVEYAIGDVSLDYSFNPRKLRACPSVAGTVDVEADNVTVDPLMFHFLNEVAGAAKLDRASHRQRKVDATLDEFKVATRQLQSSLLARAWTEIAITAGWDAVQAVVPLGFTTKLATDFVVEVSKEVVKGTSGEGLEKWVREKIPALVAELGLDSDEAKRLADGLQNAAKVIARDIAEVKPIVLTATGTAGECDVVYTATLIPGNGTYHVNFDKFCGEPEPDVPTGQGTSVSVDPGDAGALVTQAVNDLGIAYPLTAATVTGLAAVMADASPEPAAVIAGGNATFNFTAAKPRKDGDYPVVVNFTTFDGKTARWDGKVTVNNVAPRITDVQPTELSDEPGERLSIDDGKVTVVDDNADKNNGGEVRAGDLSLGPHPADLEMSRNNAFGGIDGTPNRESFDSASGTYVFTFQRDGGRIRKPQMHKTVPGTVTIQDDNGASANGSLSFEVEDVAPEISNVEVEPANVHRNEPPKTITLRGRITDDNGSEDIDRPESFADVSKASSGAVTKLVLGNQLQIVGTGEDYIDFEGTFPQTNVVGSHDIDLLGKDRSTAAHPDGGNEAEGAGNLNVGNAKPVINPWGYIYDRELGLPEPDQRGDGLCPGQPFLAGAIVTDPEGDALVVTATIRETGAFAQLLLAPGDKTHKGTLHAPGEPGDYTLVFEARERDLDQVATPTTSPLTVIPCAEETIDDLGWESRINPDALCPGDPFTAEGFVIHYLKDGTQRRLYPPGTITFLGRSESVGPRRSVVSFTAPNAPGQYPVGIVVDIGGTPQNLGGRVTVNACGLASAETGDILVPGGGTIDVLDDPELFNPVSGSRDGDVQLMIADVIAEETAPLVVHDGGSKGRPSPLGAGAWVWNLFRQGLTHRATWASTAPAVRVRIEGGSVVRPLGARQSGPGAPSVRAFFTSLGTSYGEAFEMTVVNEGDAEARLVGRGVVLEPLKNGAMREAGEELSRLAGANRVTARLDAYCLEFTREPPEAGAVFRIASDEIQERFEPVRHVLEASRELERLGALTPDTDPSEYFHSIRQWAIWSKEQGFDDVEPFGEAFLERTKKNFEASRQRWTGEIESAVRGLVPNRWKDVAAVLERAERLSGGGDR